jgi:hypothetical protein
MSRTRDSNFEIARLAPTTALASTSSRRTERFYKHKKEDFEKLVKQFFLNSIAYLDFNFQRLLDSFNFNNAFLFFMKDLNCALEFDLLEKKKLIKN